MKQRPNTIVDPHACHGCDGSLLFLQTKIECIKQVKESEAETMLRTQFKMELIIYTQDSMYSDTLSTLKVKEEEGERQKVGILPNSYSISCSLYNHSNNRATLEELMRHLKSYYSVSGY